MRYSIAHLPEGAIKHYHHALVSDLAARFDLPISSEYFPTHVTLKASFEKADLMVTKMEVEKFARAHAPHPFILDGFGHFNKDTIFLNLELPKETALAVEGLRNAIRKQLPETSWKTYEARKHFHVTIAKGVAEKFDEIWAHLQNKSVPDLNFLFNNIAILRFEDKGVAIDTMHHIGNKHR